MEFDRWTDCLDDDNKKCLRDAGVCLLALEGLTRLFLDNGMLYELEMWKYAREVKERDLRPDIGHRHRPNAHAELMGRPCAPTARLPLAADPRKAPPGTARIAFVGNSIAMGWGVAEKDTFAIRVIADLQAQGHKVDGFNMGVGNYNTLQELAPCSATSAPRSSPTSS